MTAIRQIVAVRFWPDDVGAVTSGRGSSAEDDELAMSSAMAMTQAEPW
jgi:hypothetical protein